ncbi:MAG: UPF0182 family protein [Nitrospirota bacterium]
MNSRKIVVGLVVLLFILSSLGGQAVNLYTDWIWFGSVGYQAVFMKILTSKIWLGGITGVLFFLLTFINPFLAGVLSPKRKLLIIEPDLFEIPNKEKYEPHINKILLGFILLMAIFVGSGSAGKWTEFLQFINPITTPFGLLDPLFSKDISFYVFKLPFIKYIYQLLCFSLGLGAVLTIGVYLFGGALRITTRGLRMTAAFKIHSCLLSSLILGLISVGCILSMYELLYSSRGVAFGASFTDIHASLPVLKILSLLGLITALSFLINIFFTNWKIVIGLCGLMLVISVVGGRIYPEIIQRFQVAPNEIRMEEPYIKLNIKYTRAAYNLDEVQTKEFPVEETLTQKDLQTNDMTIKNIRLWDQEPLLSTYGQLQEIRTYYKFVGVDNDRYVVNGEYRQMMLSPRELSYEHLPSKIWMNEHLTYTHGYGICLGPVNRISKEGLPEFMIKDIPPVSLTDLKLKQPEIYYGELPNEYCFVKTKAKEFDYPAGDKNVYTNYTGRGGVPINSLFRKMLFATRFQEPKIFFSNEITNESRVMLYRGIKERIDKICPFISYDQDPYMVISDGKLYWICDGYTATNMYPYSEPMYPKALGRASNYIRNSVKVVVDAYNGDMKFYISDSHDPIIQMYAGIFPEVFLPLENMSQDLRNHLRYPVDMFTIQAMMYSAYHMQDPQVFYNKEDLWAIPKKVVGETTAGGATSQAMEPYYTIMKLGGAPPRSGESKEEFILMIPFTPASKDNMIAWLAARCDAPNYGKLLVYNFSKEKLIYGPTQIEARINQDAEISQQLSLWDQHGSNVHRGSLLVIPVENSLLYVQPLYLVAQEGKIPELKRVIVGYGDRIAMKENLEQSLAEIFGGAVMPTEIKEKEQVAPVAEVKEEKTLSIKELAAQGLAYFQNAEKHLREGNWAGYGEQLQKIKEILRTLGK